MNEILYKARNIKNYEFYTCYNDIDKELNNYSVSLFKDKIVYCPCDSLDSEFVNYFNNNFDKLGLKELRATSLQKTFYVKQRRNYFYTHIDNGNFLGDTCKKIMNDSDIIITNPPFSLFKELFNQIRNLHKKFLLLTNQNALMYKEIFPWIMNNEIWLGKNNGDMSFKVPNYTEPRKTRYWVDETGQKWRSIGNACWLTNLDLDNRHIPLDLKEQDISKCKKYDTYNALNIDKVKEIPKNYDGKLGVPMTYLHKYCPEQFNILGELKHGLDNEFDFAKPIISNKELFTRIIIQKI